MDFCHGPLGAIAGHSRVALYGEGPDNAMHYEWKAYARYELEHLHIGRLLRDVVSFPLIFHDFPIRKTILNALRKRNQKPEQGKHAQEKHSYNAPRLEQYGNLRDLTRQVTGGTGKNDNQGGGNQKTGL